jgi:hypothetical protein
MKRQLDRSLRHGLTLLFLVLAVTIFVPNATSLHAQPNNTQPTPPQQTTPPSPEGESTGEASGDHFLPLTNLPGIQEVSQSNSLPQLLNTLYKLCIGAAAVIAILQIMRAGVYFMFNKGSIAQNEKAKGLIQNSVMGLILVLSPAIVFGIINPDILKIDLDFSGIAPGDLPPVGISEGGGSIIGNYRQTLAQGIDITVQSRYLSNGFNCDAAIAADQQRCREFVRECSAANDAPHTLNTGVRNGCPNNAQTCAARLTCDVNRTTVDSLQRKCALREAITPAKRSQWDAQNVTMSSEYRTCRESGAAVRQCRQALREKADQVAQQLFPNEGDGSRYCIGSESLNYAVGQYGD